MHFNLIEISSTSIPRKDCHDCINGLYDDPTFIAHADHGGEPVMDYEKELYDVAADLAEVATVNRRKRTIRFHSKKSVIRAILRSESKAFRNRRKELLETGKSNTSYLVTKIERACRITNLYYRADGINSCFTGSELIDDYLNGYLPQTIHIGRIADAHR